MDRRAVVRMTGDGEDWPADGASLYAQLDDVGHDLTVLAARTRRLSDGFQLVGGRWTDDDRVVPRQPRDRLRQLLQPAVVRKPAVQHRWIVLERHLERGLRIADCGLTDGFRLRDSGSDRHVFRRERGVRDDAVVEPASPVAVVFRIDLPEFADDVVRRP